MQHYAKNQGVAVPQYVLPESCGFDYRLSKSFNYQTFFNPLQYLCGHPKGQEPHVEDHESLILPLFYPPLIHQCKLKDRSHMLDIINSLQKGKITHLCVSQAAVPPDLSASHRHWRISSVKCVDRNKSLFDIRGWTGVQTWIRPPLLLSVSSCWQYDLHRSLVGFFLHCCVVRFHPAAMMGGVTFEAEFWHAADRCGGEVFDAREILNVHL